MGCSNASAVNLLTLIYQIRQINLNTMIMEATLNYSFKRKTENHFDWLLNIIKSEKYYEADSYIVPNKPSN